MPSTLEDGELSKILTKVDRPTSKLRGSKLQGSGKSMSKATAAYTWVKQILSSEMKSPNSLDRDNSLQFSVRFRNPKRSVKATTISANIKSECPTALIAPSDYVHIYKNDPLESSKQISNVNSDTPSIALPDYIHIYKNEQMPITVKQVNSPTSDAPTALIAPSDYVHIYKNHKKSSKETGGQVELRESRENKPFRLERKTKKLTPPSSPKLKPFALKTKSDCPTALIAPSDYVHIYKNTKEDVIVSDTNHTVKRKIFLQHGVPESLVGAIENFIRKLNKKY